MSICQRQAASMVDLCESMVRGIIKGGVSPNELLVGMHNAFVHGELFGEADLECSEESLGKLFNGLDIAIEAAKEII